MSGAVIAVRTSDDFLQINPLLHIIAIDGCFSGSGAFEDPLPITIGNGGKRGGEFYNGRLTA
jgi:hypothetical protein